MDHFKKAETILGSNKIMQMAYKWHWGKYHTYLRAEQSVGWLDPEALRRTTSSLPRPWSPHPTPPAQDITVFPQL
jgi:hypothetical protein